MKKKGSVILLIGLAIIFSSYEIISNPTGAPIAAAGSPGNGGTTCAQSGCHPGSAAAATNIITTDIPLAGYTPGSTYNISITLTGSGWKGFEISPQRNDGAYMGTLMSGSGSKIVFTKYITHSTDKSANPAIWSFKWQAPPAGSGEVTFYGAFAISKNLTKTQALSIQENTTTGFDELNPCSFFTIYPNPVVDELTVSVNLNRQSDVKLNLISYTGDYLNTIYSELLNSGSHKMKIKTDDIKTGIYLLEIKTGNDIRYEKIMIHGN